MSEILHKNNLLDIKLFFFCIYVSLGQPHQVSSFLSAVTNCCQVLTEILVESRMLVPPAISYEPVLNMSISFSQSLVFLVKQSAIISSLGMNLTSLIVLSSWMCCRMLIMSANRRLSSHNLILWMHEKRSRLSIKAKQRIESAWFPTNSFRSFLTK